MRIEVLVATMNQKDLSKYYEMNLNTDAVFANQWDKCSYNEKIIDGCKAKMITSNTTGVGRNRNIAIINTTADICVFADDDMKYVDSYETIIIEAFNSIPDADMIIFNIETIGNCNRERREISKIKRVRIFNSLNYGAARIAVKKEVLYKKNLWFSLLYGGGAKYSAGEDSLFIIEALNKGLKIYTYPMKIADVSQEESTWFEGYTDKYFYDKGIWLANAFPNLKYFLAIYYSFRMKNMAEKSFLHVYKLIVTGIKNFNERK